MDNNFIVRVHRGTMYLPDDAVGGYQVFDVKQDKLVAIFYFNPLSQPEAYFKAEDLCYELNEKSRKNKSSGKKKNTQPKRWEK